MVVCERGASFGDGRSWAHGLGQPDEDVLAVQRWSGGAGARYRLGGGHLRCPTRAGAGRGWRRVDQPGRDGRLRPY